MEEQPINSEKQQPASGRLNRTVSGVQSGAVNVLGATGAVVFAITIILCAIVIPLLMLIIGARNIDNCPINSLIPVYLIVGGALTLFLVPISAVVGYCIKSVSHETGAGACLHFLLALFFTLLGVFSFAWFICGNVWVFRAHEPSYDPKDHSEYCDELTYKFSFWVIILTYICSMLSCCCSCCFKRKSTYEDFYWTFQNWNYMLLTIKLKLKE